MTIIFSMLYQLSHAVASGFIPLLPFAPTFISVLKVIDLCLIFIFGLTLALPEIETSHFGARVLTGKAPGFDNLYFCKELIGVPSNGLDGGRRRRFCDLPALGTLIWRFSRTCSLG
jgi:hypothetical protein